MTPFGEEDQDRSQRDSTLDSVHQAAGIFSLYGAPRDSWVLEEATETQHNVHKDHPEVIDLSEGHNPSFEGLRLGDGDVQIVNSTAPRESLEVLQEQNRSSDASWSGPLGALKNSNRFSEKLLSTSSSSTSLGPPITVTADNSPERPRSFRRSIALSESNRLSPSPSPGMGSSSIFGSNFSQSSLASTQHPGEEPDAFHVRSTYARLEVDGVYGDGWDEGIERTRERAQAADKRATIHHSEQGQMVGDKERQVLANLDRYGFVVDSLKTRSESRLALLPAAPFMKIPKLSSRSSLNGTAPAPPLPTSNGPGGGKEEPPPKTPPLTPKVNVNEKAKESERTGKWEHMLKVKARDAGGNVRDWAWNSEYSSKVRSADQTVKVRLKRIQLQRRVYKGIPDRWRMAAWWTMIQEEAARKTGGKGKQKAKVDDLAEDYRHAMDLPSSFDVQIDLDVPRTISGHVLFHTRYGQGQRSLFHLLHCFSMICPDCGYCQGMGPIAATLLCYFDPERAYALLVEIHNSYDMHSVFAPGFPGLLESIYVQERLIEFILPEVYTAFQQHIISGTSYATKWYITLFSNTVPFRTQLRLWDALFLDGQDVMVLMSFAIVWAFRHSLSSKHANFETILSLLSSYFVPEDEDALLRWIRKMLKQPGFKARLQTWRLDWRRMKETGEANKALL